MGNIIAFIVGCAIGLMAEYKFELIKKIFKR